MSEYHYSFGHLQWQGVSYRKDLIILADEVICPWRREHGHRLQYDDLVEITGARPQILIIGTGKSGAMDVPDEVLKQLAEIGIDGRPMPTAKALEHLVQLRRQGKDAAAALHLTC